MNIWIVGSITYLTDIALPIHVGALQDGAFYLSGGHVGFGPRWRITLAVIILPVYVVAVVLEIGNEFVFQQVLYARFVVAYQLYEARREAVVLYVPYQLVAEVYQCD